MEKLRHKRWQKQYGPTKEEFELLKLGQCKLCNNNELLFDRTHLDFKGNILGTCWITALSYHYDI